MLEPSNRDELPTIPGKRYFTIGEVSELCLVKPHILRYWEQEFPQLKPVKRRGNRRYYQRRDVLLIRQIRSLLYEQGYTIGGARQQMKMDVKGAGVSELPTPNATSGLAAEPVSRLSSSHPKEETTGLKETISELETILSLLED